MNIAFSVHFDAALDMAWHAVHIFDIAGCATAATETEATKLLRSGCATIGICGGELWLAAGPKGCTISEGRTGPSITITWAQMAAVARAGWTDDLARRVEAAGLAWGIVHDDALRSPHRQRMDQAVDLDKGELLEDADRERDAWWQWYTATVDEFRAIELDVLRRGRHVLTGGDRQEALF